MELFPIALLGLTGSLLLLGAGMFYALVRVMLKRNVADRIYFGLIGSASVLTLITGIIIFFGIAMDVFA